MKKKKSLLVSILSLSLLTVMAGAAVAPALGVIRRYFSDANPLFVQMIISMPAIFIVITNFLFPRLCKSFGTKTLVFAGLLLYTGGGCLAGAFSSIGLVLVMRALVGIGVGIIMPLSTGLLTFYFPPEKQEQLMGYSSAMNQMGGVVATLLAGLLAEISWRCSFLVYLLGLGSIVLCLFFLPNDRLSEETAPPEHQSSGTAKTEERNSPENASSQENQLRMPQTTKGQFSSKYVYVIAMFLLMTTFFLYPANFAMETAAEGLIPQQYVAVIMAGMDFVAFFGGLLFVHIKKLCGKSTRFLAPALFLCGYLLLALLGGWVGTLAGSICVGFANGAGIPYIISEASMKAGKTAATTVIPFISAALYLAQFLTPIFMSAVRLLMGDAIHHLPYWFAAILAALFVLWSALISPTENQTEK